VIRFSVIVSAVAIALGLLVAGAVSGTLVLVYVAIVLASLALLLLIVGVFIWRDEVFGPQGSRSARVGDATGGAERMAGGQAGERGQPAAVTVGARAAQEQTAAAFGTGRNGAAAAPAYAGSAPGRDRGGRDGGPADRREDRAGDRVGGSDPGHPETERARRDKPRQQGIRRGTGPRQDERSDRAGRAAQAPSGQGPGAESPSATPAVAAAFEVTRADPRHQPDAQRRIDDGNRAGPARQPGADPAGLPESARSASGTPPEQVADRAATRQNTQVAPAAKAKKQSGAPRASEPAAAPVRQPPGAAPVGQPSGDAAGAQAGAAAVRQPPGAAPVGQPSGDAASAPAGAAPMRQPSGDAAEVPGAAGVPGGPAAIRGPGGAAGSGGTSSSTTEALGPRLGSARAPADDSARASTAPARSQAEAPAAAAARSQAEAPPVISGAPVGTSAAGSDAPVPAPAAGSDAPGRTSGGGIAANAAQSQTGRDPEVTIVPGIARYHKKDCILIRFLGEDDLERMSRARAEESGCVPCRACRPDKDPATAER